MANKYLDLAGLTVFKGKMVELIPTKTSQLTNDSNFGTYSKPSGGIPKTDLAEAVQTSLGKADTALQSSAIANMEVTTNKVTSLSGSSTDTQYPSAKLVYDQLALKQGTLTAGDNISISSGTISATDTTYSDFTGTDGTAAGSSGLVPGPATTDSGKFLKADGNWATPPGTTYSAGTRISISDQNVISTTAEVNTIETVKVDGTALTITSKAVNITGKENTSNKVTSISSSSTDDQYPSAKCVYDYIDTKISSTYKAKGSCTFANKPTLAASHEGEVWNISDAFTTTSDFVEGSGNTYPAGTNIVVVNTTGSTYKYDVLAGFVDLSGYMQTTDMVAITTSEINALFA